MDHHIFKDNIVIITGASTGIGRELAYQLADQGALLALAARNVEQLELVATECRKRGGKALVVPTDVSEQAQCENLVAQTVKEYGRVDTLINNAGVGMWARLEDIQDPSFIEQIMKVNYLGSVYCTFYALPYLKQTRGRIVCVSSLAGKVGLPARSGYSASKHALGGFFDAIRIEVAECGISVTLAFPDFVATETRKRNFGPDGKPLGKSPAREEKMMAADVCARYIIHGAARRRREVVMTLRGKIQPWVKLISPGMVDRFAHRAIEVGH